MVRNYYQLAKPGIVYGNVFTTLAAFLFASQWHFSAVLFFATLIGIALVIASGCVFNNYLDRGIDKKMERTKDRVLVTGAISTPRALIFGTVLGLLGISLLYLYVNALTACAALFGFFVYVVVYGWAKRASHWGTVVGSVAGAVPILVGYTAVAGRIDAVGLVLFLILALWQMPHFYAISIYRMEEYRSASIPVLPIIKGIRVAKINIIGYITAFTLAACALYSFGTVGYSYVALMLILGVSWLWRAVLGFRTKDDIRWARSLFFFSLIVLVSFSLLLSVAWALP